MLIGESQLRSPQVPNRRWGCRSVAYVNKEPETGSSHTFPTSTSRAALFSTRSTWLPGVGSDILSEVVSCCVAGE